MKANRQIAVRWVCDSCEDYQTAGDLPLSVLDGTDAVIHDLPKRVDNTHGEHAYELPACAVCENRGEHFHHWSPVSIFPEWPGDLGAYLCEQHHREWHERMRAHGLRWPHELNA